jgi:hypothetical protein
MASCVVLPAFWGTRLCGVGTYGHFYF